MLAYDVFTSGDFNAQEVTDAAANTTYIPGQLKMMGLYEPKSLRTTEVRIVRDNDSLRIIDPQVRGSQGSFSTRTTKNQVILETFQIKQEDRINSHEMQDILNKDMAFITALAAAEERVAEVQTQQRQNLELTTEYHRLAGLNGYILNGDGSVFMDVFDEFGFTRNAPVPIDFAGLSEGELRETIERNIVLPMIRTLNQSFVRGRTMIYCDCSDDMWFALMKNVEVRAMFLGHPAARQLGDSTIWDEFVFAGVTWRHYRGTDDNETIAITPGEGRFYPVNGVDVFKQYFSPGEDFMHVNTPGQEVYASLCPDPKAPNQFRYVDLEMSSFQLPICIKPQALINARVGT